jgi:hypothetical protein
MNAAENPNPAAVESGWSTGGKRLVLTVTTGRTGTSYLRNLLRDLPELRCLHEPVPSFVEVLRAAQRDPAVAEAFWLEKKLPFIRAQPGSIYFETGHLACKGFIEPLLAHDIVPDLVILQRDKIKVATSLYLLDTVPARSDSGLLYLLAPDDPGVTTIEGWRDLHDWALCYWYCLEIERRAAVYKQAVEGLGGRTFVTSVDELKNGGTRPLVRFLYRGYEHLLPSFPISPERIDQVVNERPGKKRTEPDPNLTPDAMREMAEAIEAAFKAGV